MNEEVLPFNEYQNGPNENTLVANLSSLDLEDDEKFFDTGEENQTQTLKGSSISSKVVKEQPAERSELPA